MTYGLGASLANYGQGQQAEAMQALGQTAKTEAELEMQNKNAESQRKAGNAQLGATGGAMAGLAVGGPWGAVVGGLVGGIAGGLFALVLVVSSVLPAVIAGGVA